MTAVTHMLLGNATGAENTAGIPLTTAGQAIGIVAQGTGRKGDAHAHPAMMQVAPHPKTEQAVETVLMLTAMQPMALMRSGPKSGQCWAMFDMPCSPQAFLFRLVKEWKLVWLKRAAVFGLRHRAHTNLFGMDWHCQKLVGSAAMLAKC